MRACACVDCHVGSGASWYVKSKLSGIRQVYYTARGTYPRPIPTPVQNLRPAQQTCEQCHWPKKFWGAQLKTFTHYGTDEQNTPRVHPHADQDRWRRSLTRAGR